MCAEEAEERERDGYVRRTVQQFEDPQHAEEGLELMSRGGNQGEGLVGKEEVPE